MYISKRSLQAIAYSALAVSSAQAQHIVENLSFGHQHEGISPNLRGIPNFFTSVWEGHTPEILSDRVIITPPWPGHKRGAIWAEHSLPYTEWEAELHFRASGPERAGGNLQVWLTTESHRDAGPASVYTAPKFDGLVLLVDQYGGRAGTIRGFLNDGSVNYQQHHDVDQLSFGQCDYVYRNLGRISTLKLKQTSDNFEVTVDGNPCFRTRQVKIPRGYYFGISASSAETPDSFEAWKFLVSTNTHEEPNQHQIHDQSQPNQQQQQQQQHQQSHQTPPASGERGIPEMLSDVLAGSIKSTEDQFADLHYRMQIMNHKLDNIWDMVDSLSKDQLNRHSEELGHHIPTYQRVEAIMRNVEKIERVVMELQRDLENKDYKDLLQNLQGMVHASHTSITQALPAAMNEMVQTHKPRMGLYIFIFIAVQIMITGAYLVYKKRRQNAPKKYL